MVAAVPFLLLAGCGGGSSSYTSGGGATPTPTPTATPSAQRYFASTFAIAGGQTAFVTAAAQANGMVSGTVSVSDGRGVSPASRAVLGTGNVSGTINFVTGVVNLNGSYTQNGTTVPIGVTGTVPSASGTGGTSTLQLGETNYNAQWVVSTTGPITSNNNNGGNASGSASALVFSANSSNITPGNLNAAAGIAVKQTVPFVGDILTVAAADVVNGKPRSVTIVFTGAVPAAGASYDLASSSDVNVGYIEGTNPLKGFEATGGTVQVTSVSGKTYTFKLTGVTVTAIVGSPINTGTGAFTIDGTITATLP